MGLIKVCQICGTEYADHADYCNVCKQASLVEVEVPEPPERPSARLIEDGPTLAWVSVAWIIGLGYLIGQVRPRSWTTLGSSWVLLAVFTFAFCVVMRNVRMAVIMSFLGLCFFVIYGLIVLA